MFFNNHCDKNKTIKHIITIDPFLLQEILSSSLI